MVRNKQPHLFYCGEWEHPHTTFAILGVSHILAMIPQCVLLFGGVLPGITILGGFIIYGQRCIMVTQKQLANLEKGKGYFARTTKEQQRRIAKKGKKASDISKAETKDIVRFFEKALESKVTDEETLIALENAELPPTLIGRMALMVVLKSATDPAMLKVLLEALGILKGKQTNVTVNNTRESPLKDFTKEELMKIAGLTERTGKTSEN